MRGAENRAAAARLSLPHPEALAKRAPKDARTGLSGASRSVRPLDRLARLFATIFGIARAATILLCVLTVSTVALAVTPDERLADPALEARAREISQELRCLVCQNQSIDDSNASLAHDLRVIVRERLTAGDSDEQVIAYLRRRYGDFVLLNPPVEPATYVLWFGPPALLVIGGVGLFFLHRRRRRLASASDVAAGAGDIASPPPLNAEERRRLDALLSEEPG
jgi:cytochrome c-type biogenesis protein CcmH